MCSKCGTQFFVFDYKTIIQLGMHLHFAYCEVDKKYTHVQKVKTHARDV